jgi:hypothetical protein
MSLFPKQYHGDDLKCGGPQMCSDCRERIDNEEGPGAEDGLWADGFAFGRAVNITCEDVEDEIERQAKLLAKPDYKMTAHIGPRLFDIFVAGFYPIGMSAPKSENIKMAGYVTEDGCVHLERGIREVVSISLEKVMPEDTQWKDRKNGST